MIIHKYKAIYLINHKCASTSISRVFINDVEGDRHKWDNYGPRDRRKWLKRPKKYLVFSAVRHPEQKALSAWSYLQSRKGSSLCGKPFGECLEMADNDKFKSIDFKHFFCTQTERLFFDGKLATDFLMRVENLKEDWPTLCKKLGIEPFRLSKRKQSFLEKPKLSKQERRLVEEIFAEDYENFGY